MSYREKAPTDVEGLAEFIANSTLWGFEADSEEQARRRHREYVNNKLGWFPDETSTDYHEGERTIPGKDFYRELAQAIIDGFATKLDATPALDSAPQAEGATGEE